MSRTDARLLSRVDLATPTLLLLGFSLALWVAGGALVLTGHVIAGMGVASLGAYLSFTPMHDAAHQSVGRSKLLNAIVGRLAGLPLTAPFPAFRWVHLEHHKHTNDPARDPDHYSGRGPAWQKPLRWLTQDLHYYVLYVKAGRSRREYFEVVGTVVLMASAMGALVWVGLGEWVLFGCLLPARIAMTGLAYAFDYLPHRPHVVLGREDRYRATSMRPTAWLTPVLVCQNHHLIHHLYPAVPFYRYPAVWRDREHELRAKGATIIERKPASVPVVSAGP